MRIAGLLFLQPLPDRLPAILLSREPAGHSCRPMFSVILRLGVFHEAAQLLTALQGLTFVFDLGVCGTATRALTWF